MEYIVAWSVLAFCSGQLWLIRMNNLTKERGGVYEYVWSLLEKDDPTAQFAPENLKIAMCKTIMLVLSLLIWPYLLFDLVRSYFVGKEEYLKDSE